MNHSLGLMIETLVAILLLLTIGYCMLLNKRLQRLKADEHSLKAVIAELITATEIAERAIGGLKHAVRDVNENLGSQLASATQISEQLRRQLGEADNVVRRLSKIAIAARPQAAGEIDAARDMVREATRDAPSRDRDTPPRDLAAREQGAKFGSARAVAAAAQAFSERRRSGGLAA
jgi:chromosome segregation ATPase